MAEMKTQPTDQSVVQFIESIGDEHKRQDCLALLDLMGRVTSEEAWMWGDSIIGFGSYHYKYASGREGDWFRMGFSPRKQNLTLYLTAYAFDRFGDLLSRLGKHKLGKGCLYINKLADVDLGVLEELLLQSLAVRDANG